MSENGTNRFSSENVIVYVAAAENVFRSKHRRSCTHTYEAALRTYGHIIIAPKAICKWHIMSFQPKNLFAHTRKHSPKEKSQLSEYF
jgi:hypothetical protein